MTVEQGIVFLLIVSPVIYGLLQPRETKRRYKRERNGQFAKKKVVYLNDSWKEGLV